MVDKQPMSLYVFDTNGKPVSTGLICDLSSEWCRDKCIESISQAIENGGSVVIKHFGAEYPWAE